MRVDLPIAAESTVAIVEAAATMPIVAVIGDSKHAIYGPNRSADTGPHRAANHATHWTGNPIAFRSTLPRAANDALRMPELGNREQRENECRRRKEFYRHSGRQARCHGPGLHVNSLVLGRDWPTGGNV